MEHQTRVAPQNPIGDRKQLKAPKLPAIMANVGSQMMHSTIIDLYRTAIPNGTQLMDIIGTSRLTLVARGKNRLPILLLPGGT